MPLLSTTPRHVIDVALAATLFGIAVPFGVHDLRTYAINGYEIGLSSLAFIAALGIVFDITRPQTRPWPFQLATFVWAAAAAYVALLPGAIVAARIGLALTAAGIASLAGGTWRLTALEHRRGD